MCVSESACSFAIVLARACVSACSFICAFVAAAVAAGGDAGLAQPLPGARKQGSQRCLWGCEGCHSAH
jgi:hypothetical protein